jgi:D-glycero-D-manno-heptose 1,7-bisphosphate phosphatase
MGLRRAVFLDRDGTLNEAPIVGGLPRSPLSIAELRILPGVLDGLHRLRAADLLPVVVTNQPNVPRGIQTRRDVEALNTELGRRLGIEHFYVCWHDDADRCECRKPNPGLLILAAGELSIDLPASFMVGDRGKDAAAGRAAGCASVLIDHGYAGADDGGADVRVRSFGDAAEWIVGRS